MKTALDDVEFEALSFIAKSSGISSTEYLALAHQDPESIQLAKDILTFLVNQGLVKKVFNNPDIKRCPEYVSTQKGLFALECYKPNLYYLQRGDIYRQMMKEVVGGGCSNHSISHIITDAGEVQIMVTAPGVRAKNLQVEITPMGKLEVKVRLALPNELGNTLVADMTNELIHPPGGYTFDVDTLRVRTKFGLMFIQIMLSE